MTRTPLVHPVEHTETAARLRHASLPRHLLDNQLDHNQHGQHHR